MISPAAFTNALIVFTIVFYHAMQMAINIYFSKLT